MSSFKNFAPMLSSLQAQADGTGTIAGSAIEDFLSIAGYETPGGGGGGGGGDYSTATVRITSESEKYDFNIVCPNILDGVMYSDIALGDLPNDFEIVLYKGQCRLHIFNYDEVVLTATGDIEAEYGGTALITGDGTITIEDPPMS